MVLTGLIDQLVLLVKDRILVEYLKVEKCLVDMGLRLGYKDVYKYIKLIIQEALFILKDLSKDLVKEIFFFEIPKLKKIIIWN